MPTPRPALPPVDNPEGFDFGGASDAVGVDVDDAVAELGLTV